MISSCVSQQYSSPSELESSNEVILGENRDGKLSPEHAPSPSTSFTLISPNFTRDGVNSVASPSAWKDVELSRKHDFRAVSVVSDLLGVTLAELSDAIKTKQPIEARLSEKRRMWAG